MKNLFIFLIIVCPLFVFSQNVEVDGGIIADSIDVNSGLIKNVADPISAQNAMTKAYVDLLEARLDSLLIILFPPTVQQRLDLGEMPIDIYNSDNSLLDSLYGKTYQGGLIAFLNIFTGTGLIAAPIDQSSGATWGCSGTLIGGTNSGIGTGQANTTLIVNACLEIGIVARLCDDLDDYGYDDWFLPSRDELNEFYVNLHVNGLGGFASTFYWSSSESSNYGAWSQKIDNGDQVNVSKLNSKNVRAVRAF